MAVTQIVERQIGDGSITDAKVKSGAAIASSKLADGANFLKKDGSVTATGASNMGTFKVTNMGAGSTPGDAVEYQQFLNGLSSITNMFTAKQSVRAASTGNITLTAPGASIDSVSLSAGNRILLKNQTAPAENGIYVFNGAAVTATRATDFDTWSEVPGALIPVEEGTVNADVIFLSTANQGGTLGTTAITFITVGVATGLTNSNFVDKEIPSGSINGSNATYTLANTPVSGSEHLYVNGILQESGAGNDYTISGTTITMLSVLLTGDKFRASYRK